MEITRSTPLYITFEDWVDSFHVDNDGFTWKSGAEPYSFSLYFDILTSISETSETEISEFPVNDGTYISDHIIIRQPEITFTASVSNNPHQRNPQIAQPRKELSRWDENGGEVYDFQYAKGDLVEVELGVPYIPQDRETIPELQYPNVEQWQTTGNKITNFVSNVNPQTVINAAVPNIGNSESERVHPYKAQPTRSGDQKYLNFPRTPTPEFKAIGWLPQNNSGLKLNRLSENLFDLQNPPGRETTFISNDRSSETYWILKQLQTYKKSCAVITKEGLYVDMYIQSVSVDKSPEDGESLTFTITMKKIEFVDIPILEKKVSSNDLAVQNSKNLGVKSPSPTPPKEADAMNRKHTEAVKLDLNANGIPDIEE